jgi:hypothetical protein
MTGMSVQQAMENIYTSLNNDNEDIDTHIDALKAALAKDGTKEVLVDKARLAHGNREGRKMMQSYFKRRGIIVTFS